MSATRLGRGVCGGELELVERAESLEAFLPCLRWPARSRGERSMACVVKSGVNCGACVACVVNRVCLLGLRGRETGPGL